MLKLMRRCFIRDTRGGSALEIALAGSLCTFAFLWMMEFCFTLYCQNILANAAREGVQYAITHGTMAQTATDSGSGPTTSDVSGTYIAEATEAWFAQSSLKSSLPSLTVCPAWWAPGWSGGGFPPSRCYPNSFEYTGTASSASPGTSVSVQVTWPYQPYIKLPWIPATLSYTATGTVVY